MNRRAPILIAGGILTLAMSLTRPATAQPRLHPVYLAVSNQAGVPGDVLARALVEVSRIYKTIGVEVASPDGASTVGGAGGRNLFVSIVPEKMGHPWKKDGSELGTAIVGGTLAYVVFERVERFAASSGWGNNLTTTLGLTIAHELGHLLLNTRSHGEAGLMNAVWSLSDARLAATGQLLFTPREASVIRASLTAREDLATPFSPAIAAH